MNQQTQNSLVFTLNDEPATATSATGGMEDWEKGLERLQQKRRHLSGQDSATPAPAAARTVFTLEESTPPPAPAPKPATAKSSQLANIGRRGKLSLEEQKQSYQAYLEYWQQKHNQSAASTASADLDNPQILFQEDWLGAQNALHIGRNEPVAAQATVWLSSRRQNQVSDGQTILDKLHALEAAENQTAAEDTAEETTAPAAVPEIQSAAHTDDEASLAAAAEKIVLLNIYAPPTAVAGKMLCLSEQQLVERLAEKLRPHLADAVAGMVKTTIQKQTAVMIQHLQQSLLDEVPQLVDDVLGHNLSRALAAIKREQL